MAVPKKKRSPSRQGMRWSHMHDVADVMTSCPTCTQLKRSHHICMHCGHYRGRHVIMTRSQKRHASAAASED